MCGVARQIDQQVDAIAINDLGRSPVVQPAEFPEEIAAVFDVAPDRTAIS
jgi:hypothetical protein